MVIAAAAIEWATAVGAFTGPFLGFAGAIWLYNKQRRDSESDAQSARRTGVFLQLRAELDANQRLVTRSIASIDQLLAGHGYAAGANDPIYDESLYLAPLFADSWTALSLTDAQRGIPPRLLDDLARANTSHPQRCAES